MILGDEVGQIYVAVFNDSVQMISQNISFASSAPVQQIIIPQHSNRIIVGYRDGTIVVYKLDINFTLDNKFELQLDALYSGQPFGAL